MGNFKNINEKAIFELLNGSYDKAYELFKKNIDMNPNNTTYNNFSIFLAYGNGVSLLNHTINDINYYKECLYKTIELQQHPKSFYGLASIFYDNNEYDKAIEYYVKGIELDNNSIIKNIARYNLAYIFSHEKVENYDRAYITVKAIDPTCLLKQSNFNYYFKLYSYILYKLNKKDELTELFNKYSQIVYDNEDDEDFEYLLSIAYYINYNDYILGLDYKRLYDNDFKYYYIIFKTYFKYKPENLMEVVNYYINDADKDEYNAEGILKKKIINNSLNSVFESKSNNIGLDISSIKEKLYICLYIGCDCAYENIR